LISSFPTPSASNASNNSLCYGFVVPLPQGEDTTIETFEDSRIRNMINDLLRENISVYWSKEDFSALSKTLDLYGSTEEKTYEKGTFVIPFSGDEYKDALITSIVNDYNQTHELDDQNSITSKVYMLQDELNMIANRLTEPKIVQHLGKPIRYGWPTYLQIADAGGFLTFEGLIFQIQQHITNNLGVLQTHQGSMQLEDL